MWVATRVAVVLTPLLHPEGLPAAHATQQLLTPTGPGWSLSVAGFPSPPLLGFCGEESGPGGLRLESPGDALEPALWASGSQAPAWTGGVMAQGELQPRPGWTPTPAPQIFL